MSVFLVRLAPLEINLRLYVTRLHDLTLDHCFQEPTSNQSLLLIGLRVDELHTFHIPQRPESSHACGSRHVQVHLWSDSEVEVPYKRRVEFSEQGDQDSAFIHNDCQILDAKHRGQLSEPI